MTQPDLRSAIAEHSWLHFYQMQRLIDRPPMVITRGAGAKVYDQDGKEYIDALAGLFCVNAGYGREPIARAMYEQATKIPYVSSFSYPNEPAVRLAEKLARAHLASGGLVVFRHAAADTLDLPPLKTFNRRDYSQMAIELMR